MTRLNHFQSENGILAENHKFGIRIPKTVKEGLDIDNAVETNFWEIVIQKDMDSVRIDFEKGSHTVKEMRDCKVLPRYQDIGCHMILYINMEGSFIRQARFVAGGHTNDLPSLTTYSSVLSTESVSIVFMIAALNDLDVFAADIGNSYLNAPCCEKIWTKSGPEFGTQQACVMLIVRTP